MAAAGDWVACVASVPVALATVLSVVLAAVVAVVAVVAALVPWLAVVPAAWAASAWNSAPTNACTALPDASALSVALDAVVVPAAVPEALLAEVADEADAAVVELSVLDDEVVMPNCASVC